MPQIQEEGECPYFEGCSAPLCPLDGQLAQRPWFPDEPICVFRKRAPEPAWMYTQRKIALAAAGSDTYFVMAILSRAQSVRHGIAGLNPDRVSRRDQIRRWLKNHPQRVTEDGAQRIARLGLHLSGRRQGAVRLPGTTAREGESRQDTAGAGGASLGTEERGSHEKRNDKE